MRERHGQRIGDHRAYRLHRTPAIAGERGKLRPQRCEWQRGEVLRPFMRQCEHQR